MAKENIKWIYIYTDGCGPCQRISPIIDTMIAMGNDNIIKKDWRDLIENDPLRRLGTPFISLYNFTKMQPIGKPFSGTFWGGFFDLHKNHPELLTVNTSPIEFMAKLFSEPKEFNLNDFK